MSEQQALTNTSAGALIEQVVVMGDLSKLSPEQRTTYYKQVCISLRLNPLTRPFSYIVLNGKLTLYANKDCTEQLRKLNDVSIIKLERESTDGIYVVTAYAQDKAGRADSSIGAVTIETLKGDARANAMMKAETKAKRRVTLSICGLGMLDETEVDTISDAHRVPLEAAEQQSPAPANTRAEALAHLKQAAEAAKDVVSKLSAAGMEDMARTLDEHISRARAVATNRASTIAELDTEASELANAANIAEAALE